MAGAHPLPEEFRARAFRTAEARGRGVAPSRLRASDIAHPFRGVNVLGAKHATFVQRCRSVMLILPPGSFVSHASAARLFAFPGEPNSSATIHVTVPAPTRALRRSGVKSHQAQLSGGECMTSAGFRHSTPARAWLESSPTSTFEQSVVVGDYLVKPRETLRGFMALATVAELRQQVEGIKGRRGYRRAVDIVESIRERVDSPRETRLRLMLQRAGCPALLVNEPLRDHRGYVVVQPDLWIREYSVTVDYEGDHHRTSRAQWMRDVVRYRQLLGVDLVGLRAVATDLEPPGVYGFLDDLQRELDKQGWLGRLRYAPR